MARRKLAVLVVDDMSGIREPMAAIIEDQGCDVFKAENGYLGIEAVRAHPVDLVFMDIKMPGINGVQAFREIKRLRPETVVVMMTGFAVEDLVNDALAEGAFAVVYKPFEIAEILQVVRLAQGAAVVLLADGDAAARSALARALKAVAMRVGEAASVDEAVRMLKQRTYDVVLLDVLLPGGDAHAVLLEVNAQAPWAKAIVMATDPSETSVRQTLESAGAYPVVQKPVDVAQLQALIERVISDA